MNKFDDTITSPKKSYANEAIDLTSAHTTLHLSKGLIRLTKRVQLIQIENFVNFIHECFSM
jgi:hypothetical protein